MAYEDCDNPCCDGALSMTKKGTEKHLEKIPGSPNLGEMEKKSTYRCCSYPKKNLIYVKKKIKQ